MFTCYITATPQTIVELMKTGCFPAGLPKNLEPQRIICSKSSSESIKTCNSDDLKRIFVLELETQNILDTTPDKINPKEIKKIFVYSEDAKKSLLNLFKHPPEDIELKITPEIYCAKQLQKQIPHILKKKTVVIANPGDSDDEDLNTTTSSIIPAIRHNSKIHPADTTIATKYYNQSVHIKGNQLILWARDAVYYAIKHNFDSKSKEKAVEQAMRHNAATISSSNDWLLLEGLFDAFPSRPGKVYKERATNKAKAFVGGVLTITLDPCSQTTTTVEFLYKDRSDVLLYAHMHDKELISFVKDTLQVQTSSNGLSYYELNNVCQAIIKEYKLTDQKLASRQLFVFQGLADQGKNNEFLAINKFLAYFNAVLFGSESSRNRLSFASGLIVLELISRGELSYEKAFLPSRVSYAVYPMASAYTGSGNFTFYRNLISHTNDEQKRNVIQSHIGMEDSRMYPQWSQIQLKEAILLKKWIGCEVLVDNLNATSICKFLTEKTLFLLHRYFTQIHREYVYSCEEFEKLAGCRTNESGEWDDAGQKITKRNELLMIPRCQSPKTMEYILADAPLDVVQDVIEEAKCVMEEDDVSNNRLSAHENSL